MFLTRGHCIDYFPLTTRLVRHVCWIDGILDARSCAMIDDLELLYLQAPVGKGQENNPDDVEAFDGRLRKVGAYAPPPEYADNPQRYATEPMIDALERFQEQNGLKIDAVAKPGGPTERAINNAL